ncbi:MAG: hypothetical protein L3J25_00165 [Flavobacteriaceae bacterium]|nr:hypothetical protein [Flavobacteriaceae bacterium]
MKQNNESKLRTAISNCFFSPTSENPLGFSTSLLFAILELAYTTKSYTKPLNEPQQKSYSFNFKFTNKTIAH